MRKLRTLFLAWWDDINMSGAERYVNQAVNIADAEQRMRSVFQQSSTNLRGA